MGSKGFGFRAWSRLTRARARVCKRTPLIEDLTLLQPEISFQQNPESLKTLKPENPTGFSFLTMVRTACLHYNLHPSPKPVNKSCNPSNILNLLRKKTYNRQNPLPRQKHTYIYIYIRTHTPKKKRKHAHIESTNPLKRNKPKP